MYILGFMESLQKLMDQVFDWLTKHYGNPLLWIALFVGGLAIFNFTYNALKKEK